MDEDERQMGPARTADLAPAPNPGPDGELSRRRPSGTGHPTPVEGIEAIQIKLAANLGRRPDRFSQLLSKAIAHEYAGANLVARSGLTPEEHAELAKLTPQAHKQLRAELDQAIAKLRILLASGDPFFILAVVQDMNLFVPWGEYYEPTHEGSEAKVELVAGLLATQAAVTTRERPSSDGMQAILDEVDHVVAVGFLFNLSMPPRGDAEVATLRFMTATRWMSLRGTSFAGHGEDLAREVYGPQGEWLVSHLGFTIDDLIEVGEAVSTLMEGRRNDVIAAGADAANAELSDDADPSDPNEAFRSAIVSLLAVIESGLRDTRTVTAAKICQYATGLKRDRVEAILRELSVTVGALDGSEYTGLYDEYPLRTRPFLELDGEYLLALPGAITRDIDTLIELRVLDGSPRFSAQRAKTLDRLAVAYLVRLLPGASGHTNLFYEGTELDGLVILDDLAVVVEGKGSGISVQGQRGDTVRLGRDIEDAVEDAWRQGARAREFLLRPDDSVFTDDRGAEILRIPAGRVRKVLIVNPTLHELAGLGPQLPRLRALRLFAAGEFPWSVYINDLRVIAETSENAAIFLHYLVWRNRLPLGEGVVVQDEIDLWASFLLCERFGMLHDGGHVIVGNSSTDFDAYYDGRSGSGPKREAPKKFLPEVLRAFVSRLAAGRPAGWREATGVCLDLSIPELAFVDVKVRELAEAATEGSTVSLLAGRLLLVGLPKGVNAAQTLFAADPGSGDPTFAIACRIGRNGEPEIVAAQYRKQVTFELSEFESRALSAALNGSTP